MKICIVTETFLPSTDGIVVRITKAIDYFLSLGYEVLVIAPDVEGTPKNYKEAMVVTTTAMTFPFYSQRPWGIPSPKVGKYIKAFNPDVVHAVNPISLAASGVIYAKRYNLPLISSFHTNIPNYLAHYGFQFLSPFIWSYIRAFHNASSYNLVTSQAMYDELYERGINNLRVLPKGVDLDNRHPKFFNSEVRKNYLHEGTNKLIIFVGRLAPEKQVDQIKNLLDKRSDVSLAVVGDGPSRSKLEKHFQGTNTIFTGFKHGKELSEIYASADAFVFPSTSETLGLVITEAMASGLPVIAAYSPPTAEQISHQENGLMYQAGSVEELSQCLDLLEDPTLLAHIKDQGRKYALQYSWQNASQAMLESYKDTLLDWLDKN